MLYNIGVTFKESSILTKEMLSYLYSLPLTFRNLIFSERTDGIICGMDFSVCNQKLCISPGIYKYHNDIFMLSDEAEITTDDMKGFTESTRYIIVLEENEQKKAQENINISTLKLNAKICTENHSGIVLGKFKGIPRMPQSVNDLTKNIYLSAGRIYSGTNETTYPSYIFSLVYEFLVQKKDKHFFDYIIMNEIASKKIVQYEMLKEYISFCGVDFSEEKIIENLTQALSFMLPVYSYSGSETDNLMKEDNGDKEKVPFSL